MPLSWNEIKNRALTFSREWKGEGSERTESQSFWNGFFDVFGIDRVSSERWSFVPMDFAGSKLIANDQVLTLEVAAPFHFRIMSSTMHNAWIRYTCGRLESRYRYSKDIVYNNFPWPEDPTDAQKRKIETAAQQVLDARAARA